VSAVRDPGIVEKPWPKHIEMASVGPLGPLLLRFEPRELKRDLWIILACAGARVTRGSRDAILGHGDLGPPSRDGESQSRGMRFVMPQYLRHRGLEVLHRWW
jgi:hypothetical protein